ncbi:MAG: hypothetical protein KDB90_06740 [Planctomycetes bacterium]|nr:hypothetical protein [Planctomycetota bacterium]
MRRWMLLLVPLLALCVAPRPASADDDEITSAEREWLQQIVGAGWSGSSSAGGVSITARSASVWSEHLEPVLGKAAALDARQRDALLDLVRIDVDQAGWLDHFAVEAGRYSIGVRQGPHNLQLVAHDAKGKVVDVDGAYLDTPTEDKPHTAAETTDGVSKVSVYWGGIKFSWKFVSKQLHDDTMGTLTERKSGRVSVYSGLPDEARIQEIADLAAKAVEVNEGLTGGKLPAGFRYRLYLLGEHDSYAAIDTLLTSGKFGRNGAFSAWLTSCSYVYYYTHWDGEFGLPSSLLEVIVHELHHQFVFHAFPSMRYSADWWQESMAELAAQRGMEVADKQAAANYRKRRLTDLVHATRAGRFPSAEDMLAERGSQTLGSYYTAAWALGQALNAQPKDMVAMWSAASEHNLANGADEALRRELDQRYPPLARIFETARAKAARDGEWYVTWNTTVDERDGILEINTEVGLGGFAVLNQPAQGNTVTLSGEFRWDSNDSSPQADFVFAYAAGETAQRFLKVALMPAQAMLFSYDDGKWETLSTVNYESSLDVAKDGEAIWHTFKLVYDAAAGQVRVDTTGGRWAEFKVEHYASCKDTLAGVGTYDAVAWFKNVKVK